MPGIKRKGSQGSAGIKPAHPAKALNGATGKRKRALEIPVEASEDDDESEEDEEDDEDDDNVSDDEFDDEEDLLASAMGRREDGGGEDDEEDDDDDNDDDEDESKDNVGGNGNEEVDMYSDEDLEGGFEDVGEESEDAQPRESKAKNGKKASLFAIPSRDEMSQLKNTSELYKSNIFRLKVDEMLTEVRPKYEKSAALDYTLRHLKTFVESLAPIKPALLPQAIKQLKTAYKSNPVGIPFPDPQPRNDSPLKFAFERPANVQLAGSWILKTAAMRPEGVDVDVVLTMPSSLFQEKDHLNHRYFYKRAFYLAVVAAAISSDGSLGLDCSFAADEEDVRRTYLVLTPRRDGGQSDFSKLRAFIKIHLAREADVFAPARLGPLRNNVRIGAKDGSDAENDQQSPTPHYNASVMADQLYMQHLVYFNSTMASCGAFADALVLLKTWAAQRCLGSGRSKAEIKGKAARGHQRRIAFGSSRLRFVLAMTLAHLLSGPDRSQTTSTSGATLTRLSPGFSSYQLFRGVIDFLANHDFAHHPIFMKTIDGVVSYKGKVAAQDFVDGPSPHVMVDPTGCVNLLAVLPTGSLGYLQREAKATLALLSDAEHDHFDEVFLRDRSKPSFFFDDLVTVSTRGIKSEAIDSANFGSPLSIGVWRVSETTVQALTTRQTLVTAFTSAGTQVWPVASSRLVAKEKDDGSIVELAVNLDPSQAFRLVDHGPRPEEAKASEAFKAFWGDRSELRRFRDGRIVESVVWNAKGPFEKLNIPRRILRFALQRHCNQRLNDADFHSAGYEALLEPDEQLAEEAYINSPHETGFQPIQTAFDELVKVLRGLDDLPLSLISIVASDTSLRSTSAMVPGAFRLHGGGDAEDGTPFGASFLPTNDFVMTFESSGQWPDDLRAVQAMKLAFFEAMAGKVTAALPAGSQARVVLDHDAGENRLWDASALEVVHGSGFAFRGRIYHARDEKLLQDVIDSKTESPFVKSQAKSALERFDTRFVHSVRHHSHIAALGSRFPSFGLAVRLLRRWVEGQMFGSQVPHELLELLTASVYIEWSTTSDGVPGTGQLGFRQCLRRLAEWEWREEPLAVALAGATAAVPVATLDAKTQRAIDRNFEQMRKLDPSMHHFAWFIATEDERKGSCWAQQAPVAATADALQRLAEAACRILEAGPLLSPAHVKALFVPAHDHFDFLVHLEPASVNRHLDSLTFDEDDFIASQKRTRSVIASQHELMAGLDTGIEFVRLLESLYSDSMRLYYDSIGGTVIGGMFNPTLANKARPFRVGLGFNSAPAADGQAKEVILNCTAILQEVRRLGVGIVREVVDQRTAN